MGYPNLAKYAEFEMAIRKVGEQNLKSYVVSKGHKPEYFERNMKIIKYTFQHGTHAASKIFHVSSSYPSTITYLYGRLAVELAEIIDKDKQ